MHYAIGYLHLQENPHVQFKDGPSLTEILKNYVRSFFQ